MSFGEKILEYREDILKDLAAVIEIDSVSSQSALKPQQALEYVLKRAGEMGLETKNILDMAGHAQYGNGDKYCGVLTHLDVVPAGNGWETEPFKLTQKDSRLYGRGVVDDKGSAIMALYCLKALKDNGITGKNALRVIFGTSEEVGMEDMKTYFANEPLPFMGFTPDSEYGVCRSEKGILQLEIIADTHNGTTLTEFKSGTAVNSVPDTAYALLDCTEAEDHQLSRLADAKEGNFEFKYTIDGLMVISKGTAAHACEPQKGFNAATHLIDLLAANFSHSVLGSIIAFLHSKISTELNGNSMGLKMRDSQSGALTLNVGSVNIKENYARAAIDIRYPVTMDGSQILGRVRSAAQYEGLNVKILSHLKPLNVSDDSELISVLKDSYREITGEEAKIYSTGGGTYARSMQGRGVAFGPVFEGDTANIHNANESISIENYFKHGQICLEAMYRLMNV
ncbi:MAG: Sapep family Mn(2+)-dependent dipeptidase [Acutalibacteraceae bacterium]